VKPIYKSLSIFLGGGCNLNCSYCFIDKENLKKITPDISKIKKGIGIFLKSSPEYSTINFTGGEPLFYWKLLRELIEYLREKKEGKSIFIVVSTNGTLFDREKGRFFEKNNVSLSVSLDGKQDINDIYRVFRNKKNSVFKTVWQNIKGFEKKRIKLSSVFIPETVDQLNENIKFFIKNGFHQLDFYPEIYSLWSKDQLKNLKKAFDEFTSFYSRLNYHSKINHLRHFDECQESAFGGHLAFARDPSVVSLPQDDTFAPPIRISFIDRMLNKNTENFCCQKLNLGPDGSFYLCDKIFSFFDERRKKYMIGNGEEGIDEMKRGKMLRKAKKEILKLTHNKCLECSWQNYCFCPIGLYLWCKENKKDFKKHFNTFCQLSKIYISSFLKIKKSLFN